MFQVRNRFVPLLALFGALAGLAFSSGEAAAQPKKPTKTHKRPVIVTEATNTAWDVTVSLDKATYSPGEMMTVNVTSARDGYLYLFNIQGENITLLFPNTFQTNNKITGGQATTVPSSDAKFQLTISPPAGTELIKAIVTSMPSQTMAPTVTDLTRHARDAKKPVRSTSLVTFKRLVVEQLGGDPKQVSPTPPTDPAQVSAKQEKEQIQQNSPQQFEQKMKQWATGEKEFTIEEGKPVPKK